MNPVLRRAVARALGLAAFAALAAHAQAPAPAGAQRIERIEVTGSNIKRVEGEGANPVLVITREEIERSGATTAYELLQTIGANQSTGTVSITSTVGALTFSANTASLRGLGGGRTLVLLNGKRLNNFSGEIQGVQGVNLSAIPFAAIERVEVLLDGASAIYGSDAIAGVVNFILRKDYKGAEATVYYGTPTRGGPGGDQGRVTGSIGFGDLERDRFNVTLVASHDKQESLEQRHRGFSNTSVIEHIGLVAFSGTPFPAFVTTGGIGSVGFPDCGISTYFPTFGERCFYDPARQAGVMSIPEHEASNLFGSASLQITPSLQGYLTGNWARAETRLVIQPVPIADVFGTPITLPPSSPFYPTALAIARGVNGQPLNVRWRAVENGNRDSTDTNEQWQVVAGLKGTAGRWDWDASAALNEGRTQQQLNGGFPLLSRIQPLLDSGRVNLFGPNTTAISDEVRATNYVGPTFDATAKASVLEARASGEAWRMAAGSAAVAFGAQRGTEELDQNPAPVLATGDLSGFGGNVLPLSRDRDTWAAFVELAVPLTRTLEVNAAVRHDDYSDFGGTTNPKVGVRWQPTRDVVFRGGYGTGFLAPSLYQLYNLNTTGVTVPGLSDPLRCPTTGDTLDCLTQFPTLNGGNANLKPEESEQFSVGLVLEPFQGFSVGVDYFDLRLSETVTNGVGPAVILADLAQYGTLVTRGPSQPQYPGLPGPITQIDQRYTNLGKVRMRGFDTNIQYATPSGPSGRWRFALSGTYMIRYDVQQADGSWAGFVSNAFASPATGVTLRWKSYQSIAWERGAWAVHLGNSYQSGYTDVQLTLEGNERRVSSMSLWDAQVAWKGLRNLELKLGARNLLDTNPPLTNQNVTFQPGYDPTYYDARGRVVYVNATYRFR